MMSQPRWYTMRQRSATELSGSPMSRPGSLSAVKRMSLNEDRFGEAPGDRLSQGARHFYARIIS